MSSSTRDPQLVEILAVVERYFGFESGDVVFDSSRSKTRVMARQLAMLFVRDRLGWSYPEIGEVFGKDHTTVIMGCRRARDRIRQRLVWTHTHDALRLKLDSLARRDFRAEERVEELQFE